MKSRFLQLVVPFLLVGARVQANDSDAVDEGGVLVLKKSEHVVMESEDLSISPHSIHVAYRFRNTSPADVDTLVAFPIGADIRNADDVRQDSTDLLELYGFKLVVDGVARSVEVKNQVTPNRQEVAFYWRQLFPAGKLVSIEHEYSPRGGFILTDNSELWKELARDYCIDDQSVATLRKRVREGVGSADQIHYILETGANWAGPIRHFRLTIRKDRPEQLVFLCAEGVRRQDALTFVIDKTNFVPRSDLKIIFLSERPNYATPAAGSALRKELLDTIRVRTEEYLGQRVLFKVEMLRATGAWALFHGVATQPNGKPVDYRRSKEFKENPKGTQGEVKAGTMYGGVTALLKKEGNKWIVIAIMYDCTDVCWTDWDKRYGAPTKLIADPIEGQPVVAAPSPSPPIFAPLATTTPTLAMPAPDMPSDRLPEIFAPPTSYGKLNASVPEPTPPATGLYGTPLKHYSKDIMREDAPDGGFIIWRLVPTKNGMDWRPVQHVPKDSRLEL